MDLSNANLATAVGWCSLLLAIAFAVVGLVIAWSHRNDKAPDARPKTVSEQGLKEVIDSTTAFAKALKDLDRAAQLWTLADLFMGIAGVVAGLDSVAQAIASTAK